MAMPVASFSSKSQAYLGSCLDTTLCCFPLQIISERHQIDTSFLLQGTTTAFAVHSRCLQLDSVPIRMPHTLACSFDTPFLDQYSIFVSIYESSVTCDLEECLVC